MEDRKIASVIVKVKNESGNNYVVMKFLANTKREVYTFLTENLNIELMGKCEILDIKFESEVEE